jgi:two-component system, chemotaxis family, protein-glutamate methylesterase/glutaminase
MPKQDIVVLGASAGGVEMISTVVAGLPRDFPAAVLVVLHVSRGRSVFPKILARAGRLPASHPDDGERLQYGHIYVAPPDHHMTLERDVIRITHGPTENGVRPAVDPLFRSAARAFGPRVIAVIGTGALDDGTAGMAAVKAAGGIGIVQDPEEAVAPSMPRSALTATRIDHVVPAAGIAPLLIRLVREQAGDRGHAGEHVAALEADRADPPLAVTEHDRPGQLAPFSCPECHGSLWEQDSNGVLRFRCRVGHAYSADSMLAAQTDAVDRALWAALRALEERAALTRKLADRARARDQPLIATAFEQRAAAAEGQASIVRQVLTDRTPTQIVPDSTELAPATPDQELKAAVTPD